MFFLTHSRTEKLTSKIKNLFVLKWRVNTEQTAQCNIMS